MRFLPRSIVPLMVYALNISQAVAQDPAALQQACDEGDA